jgi:hypothetical protein
MFIHMLPHFVSTRFPFLQHKISAVGRLQRGDCGAETGVAYNKVTAQAQLNVLLPVIADADSCLSVLPTVINGSFLRT